MFWFFWANKRENEEMENINELENCVGESEQTALYRVSVLGPNWSFLKTCGCAWYYPNLRVGHCNLSYFKLYLLGEK